MNNDQLLFQELEKDFPDLEWDHYESSETIEGIVLDIRVTISGMNGLITCGDFQQPFTCDWTDKDIRQAAKMLLSTNEDYLSEEHVDMLREIGNDY